MADEKRPVEELTYKEASRELELIIRNLESGDLELEADGTDVVVPEAKKEGE